MIVKTKNPIEYQNKNTNNIETRGGYDGEDVGGFISFNGEEFVPFDGQTDLDTFTGADGETYHYSFNNDEYYNAKGEKIGGFFKSVGKGIGKGAKAIVKGIKFIGGKIKARTKKIAANVKARQDARKVKKGARKLIELNKEDRNKKKDIKTKTFKDEKAKAQAQVIYEKQGQLASKILEKQRIDNENLAKQRAQEIEDIKNKKYDKDKEAKELAKMQAKVNKDKANAEVERKRVESAKTAEIEKQIAPFLAASSTQTNEGTDTVVELKLPLKEATEDTKPENKVVINDKTYDNEGNKNVEAIKNEQGKTIPVLNVPADDVVAVTAEDGNIDYYKKKDVIGMTLTTKILIGVGAVAVLGLITFLIIKRKK